MTEKKSIVHKYQRLLPKEAMLRLNDDIKADLKKQIQTAEEEIATIKKQLGKGKNLRWG